MKLDSFAFMKGNTRNFTFDYDPSNEPSTRYKKLYLRIDSLQDCIGEYTLRGFESVERIEDELQDIACKGSN